jgi:hypothetical protein
VPGNLGNCSCPFEKAIDPAQGQNIVNASFVAKLLPALVQFFASKI